VLRTCMGSHTALDTRQEAARLTGQLQKAGINPAFAASVLNDLLAAPAGSSLGCVRRFQQAPRLSAGERGMSDSDEAFRDCVRTSHDYGPSRLAGPGPATAAICCATFDSQAGGCRQPGPVGYGRPRDASAVPSTRGDALQGDVPKKSM
jgi:hypothetical protein